MLLLRPRSPIVAGSFLLGVLILAVLGCHKHLPSTESEDSPSSTPLQTRDKEPRVEHYQEPRFPRRLLFISINRYSILNPLVSNDQGKSDLSKPAALKMAQGLKIPAQKDAQVYLVSDTAPPPENNPPTREVVVGAYERFFATSKQQDRIVVYFGGHALEVDGKAYLAPLEGNKNDPRSLIPLADFYAKLKACKATQRVVIWDVCRLNPERGRSKPGSDAMTPTLLKALTYAPEGVEVVVACQPGEHALEYSNLQAEPGGPRESGSAFLEAMKFVVDQNRLVGVVQTPSNPIPVAEWTEAIARRVAAVAASPAVGLKQTVRYYAAREESKGESILELPTTPVKSNSAEVQSIADEFRLPPMTSGRTPLALAEFPFNDDVIAAYKPDISLEDIKKNKQKYAFRNTTLNAYQVIRDIWSPPPPAKTKGKGKEKEKRDLQYRDSLAAPIKDEVKKAIKKELDDWGIGIARLDEVNRELEEIAAQKKNQPRRWQAHYDYARAIVKYRLAFMNEYDKLMGDVLTETLPALDKSQNGYKLVSSEKMKSKKDIQRLADEAREALDAVIVEYKDSPWALQAKYDKEFPLGLLWQPKASK